MGLKQSTWVSLTVVSIDCNAEYQEGIWSHIIITQLNATAERKIDNTWRMEMEKVAVFPVPDCACAITSLPLMIGLIARC